MRLINARTKQLEEFFGDSIPKYAILSHTWGSDEILFQDLRDYNRVAVARHAPISHVTPDQAGSDRAVPGGGLPSEKPGGWTKIIGTCRLALEHGLEYIWIDSSCIDKTSSTELQEAINTMFRWYKESAVCIVFLSDVARPPHDLIKAHDENTSRWGQDRSDMVVFDGAVTLSHSDLARREREFSEWISNEKRNPIGKVLVTSRWFTRGWTLQELLAPTTLKFYDRDWALLGDLAEFSVVVSERTGISRNHLSAFVNLLGIYEPRLPVSHGGVAERLSWASGRQTTRAEDRAYSLLGIFDISMPLLYGEGEKAFERLQEEIMRAHDDATILAWGFGRYQRYYAEDVGDAHAQCMLARSPDDYEHCGGLELLQHISITAARRSELSITPRGFGRVSR